MGEKPFRAREVFRWIHHRGELDVGRMLSLPQSIRAALEPEMSPLGTIASVARSDDGTRKAIIRLEDGSPIETVLIPRVSGPGSATERGLAPDDPMTESDEDEADLDEEDGPGGALPGAPIRVSQCISTQVGCAMGCTFCASGVAGLKRHLRVEEIVGQVLLAKTLLEPGEVLRNVVYMGMGEPLHNYDATRRSLELLTHRDGIALSTRRVTVSTSGLIPEIERLGKDFEGQIGLAVSLHAATDEQRSKLMPINKKYPIRELISALKRYPLPPRRRITIEYTLVATQNDTDRDADELARVLRPLRVKINLIPMNPIELSALAPPNWDRVYRFQERLTAAGYSCFIRRQRGDDVAAACGQLALRGARPKVKGFRSPS